MKVATVNFKTDPSTKQKAQDVASRLGIPLSNLLNAYLYELAETGSVHFSVAEPMTREMEEIIAEAEKDIQTGNLSRPFETLEDMFVHLDSL